MRARTFGRSFESIIGDLYYATSSTSAATGAVTASAAATATTATSTAQTGSSLKQTSSPPPPPTTSPRRRTIYQLPVFGESQAFWRAIDRLSPSYQTTTTTPTATTATTIATATAPSTPAFSSQWFLSGLQELIDPDATRYAAPVKYPSQIYTRPVKYSLAPQSI